MVDATCAQVPPKSVNPLQFLATPMLSSFAGKGGVGKTTVTAGFGQAASDQLRVLVVGSTAAGPGLIAR